MYASQILSAAAIRELATLAPEVAAKVKALQAQHRIRKVRFSARPAGFQYILGEGESITFYAPNGKSMHTKMVSESTLGASIDGINYMVGKPTPALPEGTWIVSEELFLGKWFVSVFYVGQVALPA